MSREVTHEAETGAGNADHDRDPRAHALQYTRDEGSGFLLRELLSLAHHAEDSDTVTAAVQVEIHQAIGGRPIHRAVVAERRRRDHIETARGFIDESHWHFLARRFSRGLCRQAGFV